MAKPSILKQSLLNNIREEYFYHKRRVDQLKHRDYPFPCCPKLLDKLSNIDAAILSELDTLGKAILQVREGVSNNSLRKEELDKIQRYGQLLGILHYVLTFFEMGSREYVPEGTVVSIRDVVKKFDKSAAFALVPIFDYNYIYLDLMKLLNKALRHALLDVDQQLSGTATKYAIFGFPLVMKQNVIMNSILAHEVGHFIDEATNLSDKILDKVELEKKRLERIAKAFGKSKFGDRREVRLTYFITPETLRAHITQLAVKQVSEWLKELVSDAIAFHLFGPVFLHSISNFLLTRVKLDEADSDHPPPRMRISLLLEEFSEMRYPSIIDQMETDKDKETAGRFVRASTELENCLKAIEPTELNEFQKLVRDSVEKVIPELKMQVRNLTKASDYLPESFRKDCFRLASRLSYVVPPAEVEVGEPATPVSILNAGGLYKMLLVEELYQTLDAKTTLDRTKVRDKIHVLVLKALELSDIEARLKPLIEKEDSV